MRRKIFKKLDRRNTGFHEWTYYIDRPFMINGNHITLYDSQQEFFRWREWCWKTWGPSKELNDWLEDLRHPSLDMISHNEHWCWQHSDYNTRIYLRNDKELSIFLLQWSV